MPLGNTNISSEKRACSRYDFPLDVYTNKKEENRERLCNIGKGGVCFRSPDFFNLNDFILFHFSTRKESPVKDVNFSILGRVAWVDKKEGDLNTYGAQFKFYNDPFSRQQYSKMTSSINQYVAYSSAYQRN